MKRPMSKKKKILIAVVVILILAAIGGRSGKKTESDKNAQNTEQSDTDSSAALDDALDAVSDGASTGDKKVEDGYVKSSDQKLKFAGIRYYIPTYYTENSDSTTDTSVQYTATDDGAQAVIQFTYEELSGYTEETFDGVKDQIVQNIASGMDDSVVTGQEEIKLAGKYPGVAFDMTASSNGNAVYVKNIFAYNESAERLIYVTLIQTSADAYDFVTDFDKMVDGAKVVKKSSSKKKSSSDSSDSSEELVDGMRPEIKEAIDSYEEFFNEYAEFMEKYQNAGSDDMVAMLADYTEYLAKYSEFMEEWDAMEDSDLNDAEMKYYLDASIRIEQVLVDVAYQ